MDTKKGREMRNRKYFLLIIGFTILFIIWRLTTLESNVEKLNFLRQTLILNKEQLQLSHQQLILVEHLYQQKLGNCVPMIYAITPTYSRLVQKAELTRISQTLQLVPNVHWIIIEDSQEKSKLVTNLLNDSGLLYTHLHAKTPTDQALTTKGSKKHRGVEQRNTGLKWLRDTFKVNETNGVVYFMDDDNTYSIKLFKEISKVKRVGVWPVGLVGGLNAESAIVDSHTGKVTGWNSGWKETRLFAIDMAGFAIHLNLILSKPDAFFSYTMKRGYQEDHFLSFFTTQDQLEPLADNCTKVYVWHTRTEKPFVKGTIPGLEV